VSTRCIAKIGILGVVAPVDYHGENKIPAGGDILEEPPAVLAAYRSPFLWKRAQATDAGDTRRARIMVGYLQVFDSRTGRIHRAQGEYLRAPGRRIAAAHLLRTPFASLSGATTNSRAAARTERIAAIRAR